MIEGFHVNNFKSLVGFSMSISKFTVLIGMNGAGKTTILQAVDFLSQMMLGNIDAWLSNRNWVAADMNSKLLPQSSIDFWIALSGVTNDEKELLFWSGKFNRKELACLTELGVKIGDKWKEVIKSGTILQVEGRQYKIDDKERRKIAFAYQGSILSQLLDSELTPELRNLRDTLRNIRSLELLSPHLMRQKARGPADDIGFGGEKLSSFLSSIKGEQKKNLIELLKQFYPRLIDIKASAIKGGWKRLSIVEDFNGKHIETEARHINDGLLRILAILAQSNAERSLLVFDEIENGVNPELVEKLVKMLATSEQQIIVTTHSPMILNYLDDATAREAVQFVYKTPEGFTRIRRFFDIPRIGEKLEYMGAGEAFVDTDLVALEQECIALDIEEAKNKAATATGGKGKGKAKFAFNFPVKPS
jgi:predicted ATPase